MGGGQKNFTSSIDITYYRNIDSHSIGLSFVPVRLGEILHYLHNFSAFFVALFFWKFEI